MAKGSRESHAKSGSSSLTKKHAVIIAYNTQEPNKKESIEFVSFILFFCGHERDACASGEVITA